MQSCLSHPTTSGFTLLEALIVVAIIGIFAAIFVPAQKSWRNKAADAAMSTQLQHAVNLTQSEALFYGSSVMLCGSQDARTCQDQWRAGYIILKNHEVLYTFKNVGVDGALHWRSFPRGQTAVVFLPNGLPKSQNGTFWFCALDEKNPRWALVMNQAGRTRIVYPNAAGKIVDSQGQALVC